MRCGLPSGATTSSSTTAFSFEGSSLSPTETWHQVGGGGALVVVLVDVVEMVDVVDAVIVNFPPLSHWPMKFVDSTGMIICSGDVTDSSFV